MSRAAPPPPHSSICKVCGARLPPDAPAGNCPACLWALASSCPEATPSPGTAPRRFGPYELIEEIARGGMGIVWKARQDGLGREVALKMILAGHLATSAQVLRFYTEARAAARLDHPNIVPIFEIGEDEGCHFYSMRLMDGLSLADALKAGRSFPQAQAAGIVATVARAVHFAHQRGVLHRDVKPSNILLDAQGEPHIADFGLARLAEEDSGASRTDAIIGTPAYMAPEQASGPSREVTTAADVYGLGAVLYELLTGRTPFEAETPLQTLRLVMESEPRPPRALDVRIDRSLDVICLKCLQKRPEKRYASAAELADDLERWRAGKPILARPASALEQLVSWARRKPELAIALGVLSVIIPLALAVSLALVVQVQRESEARAVALRSEESQRLAFQSLGVVHANPGQALLLALESAARAPSLSSNNALLASLVACRERRRFLGHTGSVDHASFSPEGERVATASGDGTARIWRIDGGGDPRVLEGHAGGVVTAVFSPDGNRVLTAGRDATARLWDAGTGQQLVEFSGHEHPLKSVVFSPDGERVLTVSRNTARVWEARSGRPLHQLDRHTGEIICAGFNPRGDRVITGSADRTAIVWDVSTGAPVMKLTGHQSSIYDVRFSPDGKRIATASDPDARVWDSETGKEVSVLNGHEFSIYSLAFSTDGQRLTTGSEDFTARIWDASTGHELHVLPHGHKVIHVNVSPNGDFLLTASYDNLARIWDLRSGALITELKGHAAPLNHAAFSPEGRRVVTASVDFTARLWTIHPEAPLVVPTNLDAGCIAAALSPDGRSRAEANADRGGQVVDSASGAVIARLESCQGQIVVLCYSNDGSRILGGSEDETARIWDAGTGQLISTLAGHSGPIRSCSFSADGSSVLTVSAEGTADVWDIHDGAAAVILSSRASIPLASFSPDGKRVILADAGWNLRVLELASGEETLVPSDPVGVVSSLDCGPDGRTIVTTSATTRAHIRSLPEGRIVATLVHPSRVMYATYSPDKRWIATTANDSTVTIWDAATHEKRLEIQKAGYLGKRVSFGGGGVMVSWTPGGVRYARTVLVGVYPLDVLAAAKRASFGELTPDERDHFRVGSPEERRAKRRAWRDGHIYGDVGTDSLSP